MGFGHLTWICLYFHLVKTHIPQGVCMRNIDGSTVSTAYCCQHYFNNSRICQECPNGTTSTDGLPCFPCLNGTYGRRCTDTCSCNTEERCHHKNGCIQIEDANTDHINDTSTVHLNMIHSSATYEISTYQETTTARNRTINYNETMTGQHSHGIMTRNLIMYLLTPTVFIVFIIVIVYLKKRQNRGVDIQATDDEGVYHTIDDNTLNENLPTNQRAYQEPSDNSEDKDGKRITEDDGADAEGESSSEVGEENILDNYLNPYQPVLMTDHQNEYAALSTEIGNNSSTESDTDSYLNPHQTVRKKSGHGEENNDSLIVITLRSYEAPTTGDESRAYSSCSDKSYQSYHMENRENQCSSTSDESYQIYYLNH